MSLPTQQQLQEAMGLRAQIDSISERLHTLLNGGAKAAITAVTPPAAATAPKKVGPGAKASKGGMSLAQRKRLSEAMKQRWAARKSKTAA